MASGAGSLLIFLVIAVVVFLLITKGGLKLSSLSSYSPPPPTPAATVTRTTKQQPTVTGGMTFRTHLTGAQQVPPINTNATGDVTLTVSGTNVNYTVTLNGVPSPADLRMHQGTNTMRPGSGCNYIVDIPGLNGNGTNNGSFSASTLACTMKGKQISDLVSLMQSGQSYINIHTPGTQFPHGMIRGQLAPAASASFARTRISNV